MPVNPILEATPEPGDRVPLVELKQYLTFFVDAPPGPVTARRVYDLGLSYFGSSFKVFRSTAPGSALEPWTSAARAHFETILLPQLRQTQTWGYAFSDSRAHDSSLMMFHGFRPASEPDMASFYRFEFGWHADPDLVRSLALDLMEEIQFLSGYGGYFLQGRPGTRHTIPSSERVYALAQRYLGCDVQDLDCTAEVMKTGYKCLSWLTALGACWQERFGQALSDAKRAAFAHVDRPSGVLLELGSAPTLGDRNRRDDLSVYQAVAQALLPLQVRKHGAFWGTRWTPENTMAWLYRFAPRHPVPGADT